MMSIAKPRLFVLVGLATWLLVSGVTSLPAEAASSAGRNNAHSSVALDVPKVRNPRGFFSFPDVSGKLNQIQRKVIEKITSAIFDLLQAMGVEFNVNGCMIPLDSLKKAKKVLVEQSFGSGGDSVASKLANTGQDGEKLSSKRFFTRPKPTEILNAGAKDGLLGHPKQKTGNSLEMIKETIHYIEKSTPGKLSDAASTEASKSGDLSQELKSKIRVVGVKAMGDKDERQTVGERMASLEQDTQAIMQQEKNMESLFDQSLSQLKDWMESDVVGKTSNASEIEGRKQPATKQTIVQSSKEGEEPSKKRTVIISPGSNLGKDLLQNATEILPQSSNAGIGISQESAKFTEKSIQNLLQILPVDMSVTLKESSNIGSGYHALKEGYGLGNNSANEMKLRHEAREGSVIKMDASNTDSKLENIGNSQWSQERNFNLNNDNQKDETKGEKATTDDGEESAHQMSKTMEEVTFPISATSVVVENNLHQASPLMKTDISNDSKSDPHNISLKTSSPVTRRHKRHQPLSWSLHDAVVDKTQKRSAKQLEKPLVSQSGDVKPGDTQASAASHHDQLSDTEINDLVNDSSIFMLGYKRFLERLEVKADKEKHANKVNKDDKQQNTSDNSSHDRDNKQDGKTPSKDAQTGGNFGDNKNVVVFGLVETGQAQPSGGKYQIRDDDEETDLYDDWIETLEFRRRRTGNPIHKGGLGKAAVAHKISVKRRGRFKVKEQDGDSKDDNNLKTTGIEVIKAANGNTLVEQSASKDLHIEELKENTNTRKRFLKKLGQSPTRANRGLIKMTRRARSANSGGPGLPSKGSALNHTLLDDADILFILKHKHATDQRQNKSNAALNHGNSNTKSNNNNSNNNNNNKKADKTSPGANHLQKDIAFLQSIYHIKSGKEKSVKGKVSRHVPHDAHHPSTKGKFESTTRPTHSGPSVKRLTPRPPFHMPPSHPFHSPFHRAADPPPVDLVYKHHQHAHRHGAAILVFLCLGVLLFVVMVLALTKTSNNSNDATRTDSSTALYVNYPHY